MRLLPIQRAHRRRLIPVRGGFGNGAIGFCGGLRQRTAHAFQQRIAADGFDQCFLEACLLQRVLHFLAGVGGMRQRRGLRMQAAQAAQQVGTVAVGQVHIEQPEIVGSALCQAHCAGAGVGDIDLGR
ncbi:hypothetical protein D9M73_228190 [compost metagenome]